MNFSNILPAGDEYVYLNSQNGVCGIFKCLDEELLEKDRKMRQNQSSNIRLAYLKGQLAEAEQKRLERRRLYGG